MQVQDETMPSDFKMDDHFDNLRKERRVSAITIPKNVDLLRPSGQMLSSECP